MKKVPRQIALLAMALLLICAACRLTMRNAYVAYIPVHGDGARAQDVRFEAETPGVVSHGEATVKDGYIRVPVRPEGPGETFIDVTDGKGDRLYMQDLRVSRFKTVYDRATGGFTGDGLAMIAVTVFCFAVTFIMLRAFSGATGPAFYDYSTIYCAGFSLFSAVTGVTMLVLTVRHFVDPAGFTMLNAYSAITGAGYQFMLVTLPLILAFAVAMAVSNVELLRHERAGLKNVLGLIVSALLVVGAAVGIVLKSRDFSGSEQAFRAVRTAENVYCVAFSYFECMLAGAVICGSLAARHEIEGAVDYVIILGCWFRKDGTLPPLIRGRVDRALAFWRQQAAQTGAAPRLVPSGGQGKDESMPEAEAMRRYLLEQGVPDSAILPEARALNTYQNMAYSKELIEGERPGARVAFATSNYHVFRSGLWASRAGLSAEGMGSNTRWWYWPNAYMRECLGMIKNRLGRELLMLAALVGFFGLLSMVLY